MKYTAFVALGIALMALLAACSPGPENIVVRLRQHTPDDIQQGRALYQQHCATCHGVKGEGQFPEAPLEPDATGRYGAPPHDETGHTWHHSDELLVRYVTEGGFADPTRFYTMPTFEGQLDHFQAMQIIAYIKTLWTEEQRLMQHHMTEEEYRFMRGE